MKTLKLNSSADGVKLSVAVLEPVGEPKGIFQISHGMAEHKERYYPFMQYLAANGYVCVIHDHRGHGASVQSPEDLGYMGKGGATALVEDLRLVQEWACKEYPGLPVTLFGHSMGSMVVRAFARKYDDRIFRLIVCGCPSENPMKGMGAALSWIVGVLRGWHYRPALINSISFDSYNKPFEAEGPCAWLSANRDNVKEYLADPLCGFCFTANGFLNLMRIMGMCYSPKGWQMKNPSMPVLFVSGADDPCRIDDKAFAKAVQFMRDRGYTNVKSKLYKGLRHEILLEKDAEDIVWKDLI